MFLSRKTAILSLLFLRFCRFVLLAFLIKGTTSALVVFASLGLMPGLVKRIGDIQDACRQYDGNDDMLNHTLSYGIIAIG